MRYHKGVIKSYQLLYIYSVIIGTECINRSMASTINYDVNKCGYTQKYGCRIQIALFKMKIYIVYMIYLNWKKEGWIQNN